MSCKKRKAVKSWTSSLLGIKRSEGVGVNTLQQLYFKPLVQHFMGCSVFHSKILYPGSEFCIIYWNWVHIAQFKNIIWHQDTFEHYHLCQRLILFLAQKQEIFRVTIVIWSLIVNWWGKLLYNTLCFCVSFIGDELVIANVQRNQDGNYYNCFAENLVRKSYKDVRLTVQCRCSHYMQ